MSLWRREERRGLSEVQTLNQGQNTAEIHPKEGADETAGLGGRGGGEPMDSLLNNLIC